MALNTPQAGMGLALDISMASNLPREGWPLAQDHTAFWWQNLNSNSSPPKGKLTLFRVPGRKDASLWPCLTSGACPHCHRIVTNVTI